MKSKEISVSVVRFFLLVFVACLCAAGLSATAFGADWPMYRGPDYNGFTTETNWSSEWGAGGHPRRLWIKPIGTGFSSMAVADGRVYAMGNNRGKDTVFCFNAETGDEIWSHSYTCPLEPKWYEGGTLSTPTVDGDVVYTLSKMGDLFCFKAATGDIVWQKQLVKQLGFKLPTWHLSSSGLVLGEMLIFNLGDAGLALNKKNGEVIWDNGKGVCGYATPVPYTMDGQKCVAIFGKDTVMGVRVSDGKVLWKHAHKTKHDVNAADPIISGNEVFISSGYGRGCQKIRISGSNVTQVWENKEMRNHMNCSMLYKGHIYGMDEGQLRCLSWADGSVKWTEKSTGKGALMMSTDGRMIIMSDRSELIIAKADPSEFKLIARAEIMPEKWKCWTTPVLANGRIYARNVDRKEPGYLVCVDVSGK
jgi:outer membrane protein assembly factor BamB